MSEQRGSGNTVKPVKPVYSVCPVSKVPTLTRKRKAAMGAGGSVEVKFSHSHWQVACLSDKYP